MKDIDQFGTFSYIFILIFPIIDFSSFWKRKMGIFFHKEDKKLNAEIGNEGK